MEVWKHKSIWFQISNVWVCICVAACWEGFNQCTDALENQIWTWGMFLDIANEDWWHVYTLHMDPVQNHTLQRNNNHHLLLFRAGTKWWQRKGIQGSVFSHLGEGCTDSLPLDSFCSSLTWEKDFLTNIVKKTTKTRQLEKRQCERKREEKASFKHQWCLSILSKYFLYRRIEIIVGMLLELNRE